MILQQSSSSPVSTKIIKIFTWDSEVDQLIKGLLWQKLSGLFSQRIERYVQILQVPEIQIIQWSYVSDIVGVFSKKYITNSQRFKAGPIKFGQTGKQFIRYILSTSNIA